MTTLGYDLYLNRYLFACRVNHSLVCFSNFPAVEMSLILGTAISERLPTIQARPWVKAMAAWEEYLKPFGGKISSIADIPRKKKIPPLPEASWPIESVLFFYPGKRNYGQGELIFWELKLIGESADHGLFLEVILPALEEVGTIRDSRWRYINSIWGHFDIQSVYMANGGQWDPVVTDGRLDLRYKPSQLQWCRGLTFKPPRRTRSKKQVLDSLTWITPFELENLGPRKKVPTLKHILDATTERLARMTLGKHSQAGEFWDMLSAKERSALQEAAELASENPFVSHHLKSVPAYWPGRHIGDEVFSAPIADAILPYLGLASIFHIGKYPHFGCGTFFIEN
jgi:hypothetical protein